MSRRRITRYNDRIGPDLSSGMMVLTIFMAAVVVLCVYFAANLGFDPKPEETGGESNVPPLTEPETEPPFITEDITDVISVSDEKMRHGYLILVNSEYEYSFEDEDVVLLFHNEEKSDSYGLLTSDISCERSVLPHLNLLIDTYASETGATEKAIINSGYRSYAEQVELLQERIETVGEEEAYRYVAMPGHSEHHTGFGLDIGAHYDEEWMPKNSYRFGFVQRYRADKVSITGISYEYWHYRYVGAPHAEIMFAENLCLEEYVELIGGYTYDQPFVYTTEDGCEYMIYHVDCEYDGETSVSVPRGMEYEISGDNVDGFIVTVRLAGGAQ